MKEAFALPAQAYVYVIGDPGGPQKIGVAANPEQRRYMLQGASPVSLVISAAIPATRSEAFRVEAYAHWLLRDQRLRGEWFDITPNEARNAIGEAFVAVSEGLSPPTSARPSILSAYIWQRRAKAAGLSQTMLARLLGRPVNTISRQIRAEAGEVPKHLTAVIRAWEMMSEAQRKAWMEDEQP